MAMSRKERQREWHKSLYINARFFKMQSLSNGKVEEDGSKLDPSALEAKVNRTVEVSHGLAPFAGLTSEVRTILPREPFPKLQNVVRDPDEIAKMQKLDSKRVKDEKAS